MKSALSAVLIAALWVTAASAQVTTTPSRLLVLPGYGSGCTLSNNAGTPNTVIDIAACATADDTTHIVMPSSGQQPAYTKTTGAWAVGAGNGGLDTGAVANNTWYYVYQIQRSDTGVVDYLLTTTFGSPTMPANYDRKRFIGEIKTAAASTNILTFTQTGNSFVWGVVVQDISIGTLGTSAALQTLPSVPSGHVVQAYLRAEIFKGGAVPLVLISDTAESDVAPNSPEGNFTLGTGVGVYAVANIRVNTNTAQQVRARSDNADTFMWINVVGWTDPLLAWPH